MANDGTDGRVRNLLSRMTHPDDLKYRRLRLSGSGRCIHHSGSFPLQTPTEQRPENLQSQGRRMLL